MNISNGEIISLVSLPYFDNSLFTSKFWESFQKAMGTHLSFSTAFYPQSQGQVERVWCYFEARVWKRIVALSFLSFLSFFEGSLVAYFDYEIWQMHAKRRPSGIKSPKWFFPEQEKIEDLRAKQEAPQRAHKPALRGHGEAKPANALEKYIIY